VAASGVAISNAAVTMGNVPLVEGINVIFLGNGSQNASVPTQLEFN
jgi:hypothetical protein